MTGHCTSLCFVGISHVLNSKVSDLISAACCHSPIDYTELIRLKFRSRVRFFFPRENCPMPLHCAYTYRPIFHVPCNGITQWESRITRRASSFYFPGSNIFLAIHNFVACNDSKRRARWAAFLPTCTALITQLVGSSTCAAVCIGNWSVRLTRKKM